MSTNVTNEQLQLINSVAGVSPVATVGSVYGDLRRQAEASISAINQEKDDILENVKNMYSLLGSSAVESLHEAINAMSGCGGLGTSDNLTKDSTPHYSRLEIEEFADHVYSINCISNTLLKVIDSLDRIRLYEDHLKMAQNRVLL